MGFDVMPHPSWGQQLPLQQPAAPAVTQPSPVLSTGSAGVPGRAQSRPPLHGADSVSDRKRSNPQVGF